MGTYKYYHGQKLPEDESQLQQDSKKEKGAQGLQASTGQAGVKVDIIITVVFVSPSGTGSQTSRAVFFILSSPFLKALMSLCPRSL